jgi:hypothetical protein
METCSVEYVAQSGLDIGGNLHQSSFCPEAGGRRQTARAMAGSSRDLTVTTLCRLNACLETRVLVGNVVARRLRNEPGVVQAHCPYKLLTEHYAMKTYGGVEAHLHNSAPRHYF